MVIISMLSTVIILLTFQYARTITDFANPCVDAPTEAARIICEQLQKWDKQARAKPPVGTFAAQMPASAGRAKAIATELAPISTSPYQCMDLECLCTYLRGRAQAGGVCILPDGSRLGRAVRKEYRMLSDAERRRYHSALRQLKRSGEYEKFALIHGQAAVSGGAHSGPAFLPWHREFMKRFEIALRQIDPALSLPYWDSTLDDALPKPNDSILWTDELLGSTDPRGQVVGGDFADFVTFQKKPHITRAVGVAGSPFKPSDIDYVLRQDKVENVLAYTAPRQGCRTRANYNALEYTHGNVHIFVGGDMFDPYTSGNDPTFYLLHSFVDYIWEMHRQQRQSRYERENDYTPDNQVCSSALHFGSALMRPFTPLRNIDGLTNKYTDLLYEFAPRPSCDKGPTCGSRYLFCDRSHGVPRCVSQVKIGGLCNGFQSGEAVCHNGFCRGGICVASAVPPRPPVTEAPIILPVTTKIPIVSINANCFNEHQCCGYWAEIGECERNQAYMRQWCKVSCKVCRPSFDPNVECSNHHENCQLWSSRGECTRNLHWMIENCRQSCGKCDRTRQQACGGGGRGSSVVTTTKRPQPRPRPHCNSPGCYNENVCCPLWSTQGQCRRNVTWMACNCKVSCGLCIPDNYDYGTCNDYHRSCRSWAARGECGQNAWMLENCRQSCRSCLDQWQLRLRCRISSTNLATPINRISSNTQDDDYDYEVF